MGNMLFVTPSQSHGSVLWRLTLVNSTAIMFRWRSNFHRKKRGTINSSTAQGGREWYMPSCTMTSLLCKD